MNHHEKFAADIRRKGESYIKQLLTVALSDGYVDQAEQIRLVAAAEKFGITENELTDIQTNIDMIKMSAPRSMKEKFHMVFDLVWMMMIDGQIHEKEMRTCENMAMQMGFAPEMVDDLMGLISYNISQGILAEETYNRLEEMM